MNIKDLQQNQQAIHKEANNFSWKWWRETNETNASSGIGQIWWIFFQICLEWKVKYIKCTIEDHKMLVDLFESKTKKKKLQNRKWKITRIKYFEQQTANNND